MTTPGQQLMTTGAAQGRFEGVFPRHPRIRARHSVRERRGIALAQEARMGERNVHGEHRQNSKTALDPQGANGSTCRRSGSPLDTRNPSQVGSDGWPPLLTASEVAAVLRTSRKAVYAMAERAQLPGITRIGRRLLVRRDDLLSWLDERRAASPGGLRR